MKPSAYSSSSRANEVPYSRAIPRPSAGPLVAALGIALLGAAIVTNMYVLVVGVGTALYGAVLWFRAIFPDERLEEIPDELLRQAAPDYSVAAPARVEARPAFPQQMHPIRGGIRGGLVGGVAMAIVACAWGLSEHHSVWLPINLLAGAVVPGVGLSDQQALELFHPGWFMTAAGIHAVMSIAVGLLYTTALPMMPRRPLITGGLLVPAIVTGLVWASLGIVNPTLERYISWPWFLASQFAFGVVCGWIVGRTGMISTRAGQPLAQRLQVEQGGER